MCSVLFYRICSFSATSYITVTSLLGWMARKERRENEMNGINRMESERERERERVELGGVGWSLVECWIESVHTIG